MYNLSEFCNIIARLRRKEHMTQLDLAQNLRISPQSVSKWECGIGYPDVSLFPAIAELFSVPIGVLFAEDIKEQGFINSGDDCSEYSAKFESCDAVEISLGNICRIEIIEKANLPAQITAVGDPAFLHYFAVEKNGKTLSIDIKNPTGSDVYWASYDRQGYADENYVSIYTGSQKDSVGITVVNYLDLEASTAENQNGNLEIVCRKG